MCATCARRTKLCPCCHGEMTYAEAGPDGSGRQIPGGWGCGECQHVELDPLPSYVGSVRVADPDADYDELKDRDEERRGAVIRQDAPVVFGVSPEFFGAYTPGSGQLFRRALGMNVDAIA